MRADITCDYDSTVDNIERRIKVLGVKRFLTENSQFSSNDNIRLLKTKLENAIFDELTDNFIIS